MWMCNNCNYCCRGCAVVYGLNKLPRVKGVCLPSPEHGFTWLCHWMRTYDLLPWSSLLMTSESGNKNLQRESCVFVPSSWWCMVEKVRLWLRGSKNKNNYVCHFFQSQNMTFVFCYFSCSWECRQCFAFYVCQRCSKNMPFKKTTDIPKIRTFNIWKLYIYMKCK